MNITPLDFCLGGLTNLHPYSKANKSNQAGKDIFPIGYMSERRISMSVREPIFHVRFNFCFPEDSKQNADQGSEYNEQIQVIVQF